MSGDQLYFPPEKTVVLDDLDAGDTQIITFEFPVTVTSAIGELPQTNELRIEFLDGDGEEVEILGEHYSVSHELRQVPGKDWYNGSVTIAAHEDFPEEAASVVLFRETTENYNECPGDIPNTGTLQALRFGIQQLFRKVIDLDERGTTSGRSGGAIVPGGTGQGFVETNFHARVRNNVLLFYYGEIGDAATVNASNQLVLGDVSLAPIETVGISVGADLSNLSFSVSGGHFRLLQGTTVLATIAISEFGVGGGGDGLSGDAVRGLIDTAIGTDVLVTQNPNGHNADLGNLGTRWYRALSDLPAGFFPGNIVAFSNVNQTFRAQFTATANPLGTLNVQRGGALLNAIFSITNGVGGRPGKFVMYVTGVVVPENATFYEQVDVGGVPYRNPSIGSTFDFEGHTWTRVTWGQVGNAHRSPHVWELTTTGSSYVTFTAITTIGARIPTRLGQQVEDGDGQEWTARSLTGPIYWEKSGRPRDLSAPTIHPFDSKLAYAPGAHVLEAGELFSNRGTEDIPAGVFDGDLWHNEEIQTVATLEGITTNETKRGEIYYLTTDNKLYYNTGTEIKLISPDDRVGYQVGDVAPTGVNPLPNKAVNIYYNRITRQGSIYDGTWRTLSQDEVYLLPEKLQEISDNIIRIPNTRPTFTREEWNAFPSTRYNTLRFYHHALIHKSALSSGGSSWGGPAFFHGNSNLIKEAAHLYYTLLDNCSLFPDSNHNVSIFYRIMNLPATSTPFPEFTTCGVTLPSSTTITQARRLTALIFLDALGHARQFNYDGPDRGFTSEDSHAVLDNYSEVTELDELDLLADERGVIGSDATLHLSHRFGPTRVATDDTLTGDGLGSTPLSAQGIVDDVAGKANKSDVGIPQVSRLPVANASSPILVNLTHDYTEGPRDDATVTPGFSTAGSGYSDGRVFPVVGTINKNSPLTNVRVVGANNSYYVDSVAATNEAWIDEFNTVAINGSNYTLGVKFVEAGTYVRRVLDTPTITNAASFTINFLRSDNTFYFTTAETLRHSAGVYERDGDVYRKLTFQGFTHVDGISSPLEPPTRVAQSYLDDLGRLWTAGDRVVQTTIPPEITGHVWINGFYNPTAGQLSDLSDGQFAVIYNTASLVQNQNGALVSTSWNEMWSYITTMVSGGDTAANRNIRDTTIFLGTYRTEEEAAIERAQHTELNRTYYYIKRNNNPPHRIMEIDTFEEGTIINTDHFFWRGFHLVSADVLKLIKVSDFSGGERLDANLTMGSGSSYIGVSIASSGTFGNIDTSRFASFGYEVFGISTNGLGVYLQMSLDKFDYPKAISLNEVVLSVPEGLSVNTGVLLILTSFIPTTIDNFLTYFGVASGDVVPFNIQRSDGSWLFETERTARKLQFGDEPYNLPETKDAVDALREAPHEVNKINFLRNDHTSDTIRKDAKLTVAALTTKATPIETWYGWATGDGHFFNAGGSVSPLPFNGNVYEFAYRNAGASQALVRISSRKNKSDISAILALYFPDITFTFSSVASSTHTAIKYYTYTLNGQITSAYLTAGGVFNLNMQFTDGTWGFAGADIKRGFFDADSANSYTRIELGELLDKVITLTTLGAKEDIFHADQATYDALTDAVKNDTTKVHWIP